MVRAACLPGSKAGPYNKGETVAGKGEIVVDGNGARIDDLSVMGKPAEFFAERVKIELSGLVRSREPPALEKTTCESKKRSWNSREGVGNEEINLRNREMKLESEK